MGLSRTSPSYINVVLVEQVLITDILDNFGEGLAFLALDRFLRYTGPVARVAHSF